MRWSVFAVAIDLITVASGYHPVYADEPAGKIARLGIVSTVSLSSASPGYTVDFWERLRQLGWVRGKNLLIEEHWAEGQLDRMPALMAEVVGHKVDLILTTTEAGAVAARDATQTIPIVVTSMGDPVAAGVAVSLSRPGGNVTGLSLENAEGVPGKCLELLREAVPRLSTVAVLWNPDSPLSRIQVKHLEADARVNGITVRLMDVRSQQALLRAFDRARTQTQAVLVLSNPLTYVHRRQVASLAAKTRLPTMFTTLDYVADGGLMAYGADMRVMYGRAAEYVDKILRGANPAELPIEQPTQFKLMVNLKTASALRLSIPESILLRADEVIR